MSKRLKQLIIATAALSLGAVWAAETGFLQIFASAVTLGRQAGGVFLLPTNQLVRSAARETAILGRPVDAALSRDLGVLAVLNTRGAVLLDPATLAPAGEIRTQSTSYAGIAVRPGTREIWVSETARSGGDALAITPIATDRRPGSTRRVPLPGHPVPTGIAFAADGSRAYVALSRNNTLGVFDGAGALLKEVPTGMAPFGVAVSEKLGRVFVTNRGGRRMKTGDTAAPTSGAEVASDASTGATLTGTVTVVDIRTGGTQEVASGLAPSGIAISGDTVAVANGHGDSLSLIDAKSLKVDSVRIPAEPTGTFGSQPVAVAFTPDGNTLYAAAAGNNAIAVLRRKGRNWTLEGSYPVGYFPTAVQVAADGSLLVVNLKGHGNNARPAGGFNTRQYEGTVERLPALDPPAVAAGTREVLAANQPRFTPAGGVEDLDKLGIQHVFLIIKENRTYDQVFGGMEKGNGDPKLVMYGRDVTPNHHALASQYVLLDNFYTSGAISFDGHHWLMQAFVSDYVERAFAASPRGYAWNLADALVVSPKGFFWQGARRPLDVRIHGEFCLPARWDPARQNVIDMNEDEIRPWGDYWKAYKEGNWRHLVASRSGVPALTAHINQRYPFGSMNISDQLRAEAFIEDFEERDRTGRIPNLSILTLNQDHTSGTRPGAPTPRAMVADNDLALGRVVEAISKSPAWPRSLILVTEDDAQDGVDHVDGHRTIGMAIGPHIARAKLDSNHYNHGSMIRTIQAIFGIPANTRFLRSARSMTSVFEPRARPEIYKAIVPGIPLDEMNPPLKALEGRRLLAARQSMAMNWNEVDDIPHKTLNQILWWDRKGYDTPMPARR
ncbi:MAG: bifunctional YncE family protein/alkaline phosphatase family protein [Acidobacteria bacterium]|nr:bifunctional YncE family protein/alkaline phosphatase family protein [Acidobacteriota bacterium]